MLLQVERFQYMRTLLDISYIEGSSELAELSNHSKWIRMNTLIFVDRREERIKRLSTVDNLFREGQRIELFFTVSNKRHLDHLI